MNEPRQQPETKPNPDPTNRTYEALHREIMWTEKQRKSDYEHLTELFKEATGARDRAITLLQAFADKSPTTSEVHEKLHGVEENNKVRFADIENKFASGKEDLKTALAAQEKLSIQQNTSNAEAIAKSEKAIHDSLLEQRRWVDDHRTRLDRIEGGRKGIGEFGGWIVAGGTLIVLIATLVFVVLKFAGQGAGP